MSSGARAATVDEALASSPDAVVVASATALHPAHLRACGRLGVPVLWIDTTHTPADRVAERIGSAISDPRRITPAASGKAAR